ncbi:MAG: glycoside hydrolase family 44 protein [Pseudomonadota bacterium]
MNILRASMCALLGLLVSCGGGGGSSSGGGGNPPPVQKTLFVATQPAGQLAGGVFATQPVVHVRANGATDTSDNSTVVTASIVAGTGTVGAMVVGNATATAVAGVVTFTNLGVDLAGGGYQLNFSAPGLAAVNSAAFDRTSPVVRSLAIAIQPSGGTPGAAFGTQPVVNVRRNAVLDPTDNATVVTASLVAGSGTAGAVLSGTTTATSVAGVATFTNLAINLAGADYKLRFTATAVNPADSAIFAVAAAGAVIPPSTPPASDVSFSIDSTQDVRAISRFIYGMNGWDAVRPKNLALSRSGGNRMTAYNWETNDSNAGADFLNQNDTFLGGGSVPNGAVKGSLEDARGAGAGMIVTMPIIGYVSADHNGGGDVANTANYLATRFRVSQARKPTAFTLTPNTADGFVYQDEYINFLDKTYPGAFASATTPIMVNLDNEPDLWQHTHARLRGDTNPATQAGTTATYAEMIQRTVEYAGAAKDVNANVQILGPVSYGWQGYVRFQDAADANNRDFLEFYLAEMAAAGNTAGRRLLDVLDVHWYPEARGACSANPMDGCRISDAAGVGEAAVVAARVAAPRSLWDSTYRETSWIQQSLGNGQGINLLPRLKDKIAANYPGTKLAITEYNYGGANHISGAIAQADVLGIFGREGLYAATLWRLEANNNFIYGGFEAFRNYNGANGSFGDTSIRAANSDAATTSVYASVDAANPARMVIVAINKDAAPKTAAIAVTHTAQFHSAQVYAVTSTSPAGAPVAQTPINITQTNAFQYSMPANSVTTLVLVP